MTVNLVLELEYLGVDHLEGEDARLLDLAHLFRRRLAVHHVLLPRTRSLPLNDLVSNSKHISSMKKIPPGGLR